MANCVNQLCGQNGSYMPWFEKKVIEEHRDDGYWIEAFQTDPQSPIGLISYGLTKGEIKLFPNPSTTNERPNSIVIQNLNGPVAMDQADITGNGLKDIIICYQYGKTMVDCDPEGGKIIWLENPGLNTEKQLWKTHYVGKSTAMHRLKIGHFTQTTRWEILGLPIVSHPHDLLSPVPVLLFRQPDDVLNATEWSYEIIDDQFFHLIHEAKIFQGNPLNNVLIASREGINRLYFNQDTRKWVIEKINEGEQGEKQQTGFYGTACVDTGKVKNDSFAYIATVEPFHGNVVAVYIKNISNISENIQWKRYVLDVYGHPNENGEGPAHHLICADFDKDGDDEFLVALRGPTPNQGVYYYKPIDISRGLFAKWKVSGDSAARIAVADFDNDGFLDFATISYYVPGYYTSENPSVNMFYSRFVQKKLETHEEIQSIIENNELVLKVPRPNKALQYQTLSVITIGGIALSLEVMPSYSSRQIDKTTYVKVLYGMIKWVDSSTKLSQSVNCSRTFTCQPKRVSSLSIQSVDNRIRTEVEGAILITLKTPENMNSIPRFDSIEKIIIENSLPKYCSEVTRQLSFDFFKYGLKYEKFKGLEFYNMQGFQIKFTDNDQHLCNIQFWAAGKGTNCGVHNHSTNRFCEVHACIINGTGHGGMQYLNSSKQEYIENKTPDSEFEKLEVPSFYEHGPLWDIDTKNKAVLRENGTVVYPWHKWQSGIDNSSNQSYDIWMAFEFSIELSTLHN